MIIDNQRSFFRFEGGEADGSWSGWADGLDFLYWNGFRLVFFG